MAEQPAHNRSGPGSTPGGPIFVSGAASTASTVGGLREMVAGCVVPASGSLSMGVIEVMETTWNRSCRR